MPRPRHPRSRPSLGFAVLLVALAGGVFAVLALYMRTLEQRALTSPAIRDQLTAAGAPRPIAQVTQALRQMKLVTVEIDSSVTSTAANQSWRGDVDASVQTPVRLLYAVDLSKLESQRLAFSPSGNSYLIRIPPPERVATEVCGSDEHTDVQVGWARLRSRAGEYYLGQARKDLYDRARELTLSPDDARLVRRETLEQTRDAVRKIVGPDAEITVAFEDGEP
jgi:hypothetical protein